MSTLEQSFVPILDAILSDRVQKCSAEFDDELFACQYGLNAAIACYFCSHHIHADDALGIACKLHTLKAAHDFLAAYQLARSSMHSQAANAIRLGCETSWQNAAFHQTPELAERWSDGEQKKPWEIRAMLTSFASQRRYLYGRLSQMAHPNMTAMIALDPWESGHKDVDLDLLLPVYDAGEIADTLRALFVAQYLCHLDFDRYHLANLSADQRSAFSVQARCMQQYYQEIVEPKSPTELGGLTVQSSGTP